MCSVPPKTCPQDGGIVSGTVPTVCFLEGAVSRDRKYTFRGPQDLANPTIMQQVFNTGNGFNNQCTNTRYSLQLPSTAQDALTQAKSCSIDVGKAKGWVLPQGCVGNNPSGNLQVYSQCCAGVLPFNKCPKGYCPNSDQCVAPVSQWCIENGMNDPLCKAYFIQSLNDSAKKSVANNVLNGLFTGGTSVCSGQLQNNPCSLMAYNFCKNAPYGACDEFLYKMCNTYTRDELNNDPNLQALCGCHLSPEQYNEYKNLQVPGGILQKQCDPLCASSQVIQEGVNCLPNQCTQTVCIMDFSNENIKKLIQEGIVLNQNCVGSPDSGTVCVVSVNIDEAQNVIEQDISVSQKCGSCKIYDPDHPEAGLTDVDCKNLAGGIKSYFANQPKPKTKLWLYLGVSIALFTIIVLIGLFIYKSF